MALWDAFRFARDVARTHAPSSDPVTTIASPWQTTQLTKIAFSDIFGGDVKTVTRAEAMKVPAVAKGRALICGTLSRQPLAKFRGDAMVDPDVWMYRTDTAVSPRTRMLWTLDDLIFKGSSLWAVQRGTRDRILDAARVPPEWWEVDPDLRILVNGKPVSSEEVILIEGPQDGLLEIGADDIRAARNMSRAWSQRVETPIPMLELHITDPNANLTDDEQDALVAQWEEARKRGGTALTPAEIEAKVLGDVKTDLYVEGRNASRLDFANFLNLPAALLEGSTATASLTYSTKETSRNELVDLSLAFWATPVEARLSMDDVVPAGTRTAFDVEYLSTPTQPVQGPAHED
ncbi:phage portal protein [Georgenia sp. H159]|uniref:phage portal protein n=1 Tax=Georgenia sp. H159 TaxID=3076115 RepID=UPI002D77D4F1|nr:phage portal protein [Georgenia sp. H159]